LGKGEALYEWENADVVVVVRVSGHCSGGGKSLVDKGLSLEEREGVEEDADYIPRPVLDASRGN
jgi:hypothetical protein